MDLRTRLNENKLEMEKNKKKLQDAYLVQKRLYGADGKESYLR